MAKQCIVGITQNFVSIALPKLAHACCALFCGHLVCVSALPKHSARLCPDVLQQQEQRGEDFCVRRGHVKNAHSTQSCATEVFANMRAGSLKTFCELVFRVRGKFRVLTGRKMQHKKQAVRTKNKLTPSGEHVFFVRDARKNVGSKSQMSPLG